MAIQKNRNGRMSTDAHLLEKVLPTSILRVIVFTGAMATLIAATFRVCWPYRVELTLMWALLGTYLYAWSLTGSKGSALALLLLVLALVLGPLLGWPRTRTWTLGVFLRARSRRLILAGLKELRTANSLGKLPASAA